MSLQPNVYTARATKTPGEVAVLAAASAVSVKEHEAVMMHVRCGDYESDAESLFRYVGPYYAAILSQYHCTSTTLRRPVLRRDSLPAPLYYAILFKRAVQHPAVLPSDSLRENASSSSRGKAPEWADTGCGGALCGGAQRLAQ